MASRLSPAMLALDRDRLIDMAAAGDTIQTILTTFGISNGSLHALFAREPALHERWTRARADGMELRADGLLSIAEDESMDVNRARLASDNIKWLLARRLASRYGDRIAIDANVSMDISSILAEARGRLAPIQDQQSIEDAQVIDIPTTLPMQLTDSTSVDAQDSDDDADLQALLS